MIILYGILYLVIGFCFGFVVAYFFDVDDQDDYSIMSFIVLFWPMVIVIALMALFVMLPVKLAKMVRDR